MIERFRELNSNSYEHKRQPKAIVDQLVIKRIDVEKKAEFTSYSGKVIELPYVDPTNLPSVVALTSTSKQKGKKAPGSKSKKITKKK